MWKWKEFPNPKNVDVLRDIDFYIVGKMVVSSTLVMEQGESTVKGKLTKLKINYTIHSPRKKKANIEYCQFPKKD